MILNKYVVVIFRILLIQVIFYNCFTNGVMLAQAPVKMHHSTDSDSLWSIDTNILSVSKDGHWITFLEKFSEDKKTLHLAKTKGSINLPLPPSYNVNFSDDSSWFACLSQEQEFIYINLENQMKISYPNVSHYAFSSDGKFLVVLLKELQQDKGMLLINLETQNVENFENVREFKWHPTKNILYTILETPEYSQLIRYDIDSGHSKELYNRRLSSIKNIELTPSGKTAVFRCITDGISQLYHYVEVDSSITVLLDSEVHKIFSNSNISDRQPFLSDDGNRIIFYRKVYEEMSDPLKNDVQIWDSNDPWIEPRMERYREYDKNYFLTAWYPKTGEIKSIETEELPTASMHINHQYALVYDQLQYEPLYKYFPNADIYIKNIKTGNISLVCRNQYTEGQFIKISPGGKYISYFRDKNWWIYQIETGQKFNLTGNLPENFYNTELQNAGNVFPYGNLGWLVNDEKIIIQDKFDIWMMSPDGKTKRRITKGREENIRYRVSQNDIFKKNSASIGPNFSSTTYKPQNGIMLELFDYKTYKTGVAYWFGNDSIKSLFMVEGEIDQVYKDDKSEILVFRHQYFNQPISINGFNLEEKRKWKIYQTNKKLLDYDLGTRELIKYSVKDSIDLKGSLLFPSNYNPNEKYPMVVKIYEKESRSINKFYPPSPYMYDGFNLLKFTMNGYFVFYPDIFYTMGDPGISALESVTTAVNKALEIKSIDKNKIGLIGHSFGGYETAFIVTQTHMFAAAVAGAPIIDVVNYYHDVDWQTGFEHMWRMENQQFRFGNSVYNIRDAYERNSPLRFVANIETPLMLWSGKMDTNVNWNQSVQMFLALRRLGKSSKMLLFQEESHVIIKEKNQRYLTENILDWMETYIK